MLDWNQPSPSPKCAFPGKAPTAFAPGIPGSFAPMSLDTGQAARRRDRPRARSARPVPGTGPLQRGIADCVANAQPVCRPDRYRSANRSRAMRSAKSRHRFHRVPAGSRRGGFSSGSDRRPLWGFLRHSGARSGHGTVHAGDRGGVERAVFARAIVARNDAAVRTLEELPRETKAPRRRTRRTRYHSHERISDGSGPAERAKDRRLSRSARKLSRGGPLCDGESARLLHLHRRFRAASFENLRAGGSHRFERRGAGHRGTERRRERHLECDVPRGRRLRCSVELCVRAPQFRRGRSRSAGVRQVAQANRRRDARLQGHQPARTAAARRRAESS